MWKWSTTVLLYYDILLNIVLKKLTLHTLKEHHTCDVACIRCVYFWYMCDFFHPLSTQILPPAGKEAFPSVILSLLIFKSAIFVPDVQLSFYSSGYPLDFKHFTGPKYVWYDYWNIFGLNVQLRYAIYLSGFTCTGRGLIYRLKYVWLGYNHRRHAPF